MSPGYPPLKRVITIGGPVLILLTMLITQPHAIPQLLMGCAITAIFWHWMHHNAHHS